MSWISAGKPAVVLAPMEGVTDAPMRAFLTEQGGFSFCVSEFLRVTQLPLPAKVFQTHVPELTQNWRTQSGAPVQVQLLGGNPEPMAETALRAAQMGAPAIDINFGCPAPTVNRNDGGATLLKFPDRIFQIVQAVRQAVPAEIPVSAKLRLGWDSIESIHRNAEMAAKGGASWITIHARTRMQGYAPPVNWKKIGEIRAELGIPVVANGDIWSFEDFLECRDQTGCEHFMLGRGAVANPRLPRQVAQALGLVDFEKREKFSWHHQVSRFVEISRPYFHTGDIQSQYYMTKRIKQWAKMISIKNPVSWFESIKRLDSLPEILNTIQDFEASKLSYSASE